MAILVGIIAPQMVKYIGRARQVKVEKEASEFIRAAQVAYVEVTANGKAPKDDVIKHRTETNEPLGIMLIDIDNFRSIKETNGYDMADKVVAKVANLFTTSFKSSDYIIRTSQDEFEIFLLRMQQKDSGMLLDIISEINQRL